MSQEREPREHYKRFGKPHGSRNEKSHVAPTSVPIVESGM